VSINRFNSFTLLGVGVGLRAPHWEHILEHRPDIDWFEIIVENFLNFPHPLEVLDQVLGHYPIIHHSVSLYPGSFDPFDTNHLKVMKELIRRTKTPYVSDHLCWGSIDGTYSHDLLPLPYTKEAVKHVAQRIKELQDFFEVPFCIENVSSYGEFLDSTMTEWEFLNEIVVKADCGILLDINNIYVSAHNHGFSPEEYLQYLPFERVGHVHLAGHTRKGELLIDTHSTHIIDEVWALYKSVIQKHGPCNTLIEWDDSIPSFDVLLNEAHRARCIMDTSTPMSDYEGLVRDR
jgi:uncharacterized protein